MAIPLYFKNNINKLSIIIAILLNAAIWAYFVYQVKPQLEPLLLHYNIFLGIDLIGPWWKMFYIPGLGSVIIIVNFILAWILYVREKILSYLLLISAAVFQIFLIISAIFIILLNY